MRRLEFLLRNLDEKCRSRIPSQSAKISLFTVNCVATWLFHANIVKHSGRQFQIKNLKFRKMFLQFTYCTGTYFMEKQLNCNFNSFFWQFIWTSLLLNTTGGFRTQASNLFFDKLYRDSAIYHRAVPTKNLVPMGGGGGEGRYSQYLWSCAVFNRKAG